MKITKLLVASAVVLHFCVAIKAQEDFLELVKTIKVMSSAKQDVEKIFGKPDEKLPFSKEDREIVFWYTNETESIEFIFSNGKCTDGWLAPKDTVISIRLTFKEDRKLAELNRILHRQKTKLNKLRAEENYHGVKESFYDDKRGVGYTVALDSKHWHLVKYYPSTRYSRLRCED